MDINEKFCRKMDEVFFFLSKEVKDWIYSYHYDESTKMKTIVLKDGKNLKVFGRLLWATGIFTEDEDIEIKVFSLSKN